MKNYDIIIIGGGPAGLAAAIAARTDILPGNIDGRLIREKLIQMGALLQ